MRVHFSILLYCVLLCSCVATHLNSGDDNIVHVVLLWLHDSGNQTQIEDVINATYGLSEVPGVQDIRVGRTIPSSRAIVDDSFDVGLTIHFNNKEALETYLVHPIHVETVKSVLRPLASKILVYDIEISDDGYAD